MRFGPSPWRCQASSTATSSSFATPYRRLYDAAMAALPERAACKLVVGALALAHQRGCEADLAAAIDAQLDAGAVPDLAKLSARFAPARRRCRT
jgi:hypothetical protein